MSNDQNPYQQPGEQNPHQHQEPQNYQQPPPPPPHQNQPMHPPLQGQGDPSQRMLMGILGILLGGLGVHRFMLGDTSGGIIRIVITVVTCGAGAIIGLIEGIIYLTKTDEEFNQIYVIGKKGWF